MQKIKIKVLDKMIEKNITSAEINFLIYISHFQNDAGKIVGIYYKDICSELEISNQTFYDIKNSLVEKNIIFAEKKSYYDWDITILNNDFINQDYKESYINTGYNIFFDKEFYALKAGEKLLAMDFIRISFSSGGSYIIGVEKQLLMYNGTLQTFIEETVLNHTDIEERTLYFGVLCNVVSVGSYPLNITNIDSFTTLLNVFCENKMELKIETQHYFMEQ